MRTLAILCVLWISAAGATLGANPTPFAPPPGGAPIDGGRDICWSQPGDPNENIGSSEVIGAYGLVSELANDFLLDWSSLLTNARWWGGYWNGEPQDFRMNLRFYGSRRPLAPEGDRGSSASGVLCYPVALLQEWLNLDCNQTPVGSVFVYDRSISLDVQHGVRYWFSVQAADHEFPPQWGRLGTSEMRECDTVFRSAYFAYPDWTPAPDVFGAFFEASQEFECGGTVPGGATTWGRVRALYR